MVKVTQTDWQIPHLGIQSPEVKELLLSKASVLVPNNCHLSVYEFV